MQCQRLYFFIVFIGLCSFAFAQGTVPVSAPSDERPDSYAIKAAKVYVSPDKVLENATVIVKDGRVVNVGVGIQIPAGAVQIDARDKTIVPGFIDLMSDYGQPEIEKSKRDWRNPQYTTKTSGPFSWNQALKSEYNAAAHFTTDNKRAEALRKLGFTTVLSHRPDGISRGSATVVSLGDKSPREAIVKSKAAHVLSFSKGSSAQLYPGSLMGMIALLRQTYLDTDWYNSYGKKEVTNLSIEAWSDLQSLPQIFAVGDKLEALRALKLGEEFGKSYILKGNGNTYQRLDGFRQNEKFIVPLTFPDAYDVADPYDAQMADYADLMHWELADANAVYLKKAGHQVAFTLDGLGKDEKTFFERLDRVRGAGMSDAQLLAALTTTPAEYLGMRQDLGTLENNKIANLIVLDEWPVSKKTKVYQTWVAGQPFVLSPINEDVAEGDYRVVLGDMAYLMQVDAKGKAKMRVRGDSAFVDVKLDRTGDRVTLSFPSDTAKGAAMIRLGGLVKARKWAGQGYDAAGNWMPWTAKYDDTMLVGDKKKGKEDSAKKKTQVTELPKLPMPFAPYGTLALPKAESFVVRNATVWTNEAAGIVENADVYVVNGKIVGFAPNEASSPANSGSASLKVPSGVKEIDGTGKHLTTGIIDEHSHIAISRGVNEGSQESTAEVRIGDVVNSEDVNIYRHLSGGVTAVQQLHGSANPIGGQSALIKLRWGHTPENLKIEGADGFIKFALGENVKQSNWGPTTRYPQTRMGVEQVYEDYFTRAEAYHKARTAGDKSVRRDLDLETLAEIVNKKRFITCHSYRQSEINMLMKVADRHGFNVNTFTHILEGYKVADKMKAHGVGASTFSDWWAYKHEVWDAIPQNGPIMHEQGVTVAYNSDDSELGRRLNQEAGKAVQFGGLSEEDAWKFVTLNPAKLLHLDKQMGSIKAGKDADLVLWNAHPMSVYAMAEKTWVDGTLYFDSAEMKKRQQAMRIERNRLAQAMLDEKNAGKRTKPVEGHGGEHYECDSIH